MGFLRRALRDTFEQEKPPQLRADIRMISGCCDSQTSADVSNVHSFQLPDPAGEAGGACTSALLNIVYKDHHDTTANLSFTQVLTQMRQMLRKKRFSQIPQVMCVCVCVCVRVRVRVRQLESPCRTHHAIPFFSSQPPVRLMSITSSIWSPILLLERNGLYSSESITLVTRKVFSVDATMTSRIW